MPALPRLLIFTTRQRRNTFRAMRAGAGRHGYRIELIGYEQAVRRWHLPGGAAIFTDFERMSPPWLEVAARLHARLKAAGAPVLNDPTRFLPRAALLKALHREGINRFTCWLPALGEVPERFPVFLRTLWAHRGVIGDLLEGPDAAAAALKSALEEGHTLSDLAFIEYTGVAEQNGVFRKLSGYGVGDAIIPGLTVSDHHWVAKSGVEGAAGAEAYAADHAALEPWPHDGLVRRVMAVTGMEFGRVDFAASQSGHAVFELNTNPYIRAVRNHPDPNRLKTSAWIETRLHESLADLARQGAGTGRIDLRAAFG